MIDDPEVPTSRLRRRDRPQRLSPTPAPRPAEHAGSDVPPAAPPPLDEWDLGDSEAGWAAVAPPAFDDVAEGSGGGSDGGTDDVPPDDAPSGLSARRRDARPAITRVLRPWFEPRPGELRGAVALLAVALAVSLALWFDASRRPQLADMPPPVAVLPVTDDAAGRADGSDGWGIGADTVRGPVVHVSGAVREPGVVTLPERSRVADAIEAAGGPMPDARLDRLNLARLVEDAERVHVPRVGEDAPPPDEPASRGVLADGRIDLNAASQAELETLPGVGPARAQAIIAEREARPFRVPGDLRRVPGIGEATFQRLAPLVAVR